MLLFNNFNKQYANIKNEIDKSVHRVLESGWYILGKEVQCFEEQFAKYIGTKYCVGVASGTDAILISLLANGIANNDEVITTNLTAFPTITAIMRASAKPVVVDIDINTGLLDIAQIENKITDKTKAIIPVHLYGQACDMSQIQEIANKHILTVIEDCAQSAGSSWKNIKTGNFGHCNAFSFYPTKNLGAYGDAGAITTNDKQLYEKILKIRNYGQINRYEHAEIGLNSRLDEIQAAILNVKLKELVHFNEKRKKIAALYLQNLITVSFLQQNKHSSTNNHLFVVKSKNRNKLSEYLLQNSIQTLIHYPIPINQQKAFPFQKDEKFVNTEQFCKEILSIPIYPELEFDEVEKIINIINQFE